MIKGNKNNVLESISSILKTIVDENDYSLEFKNNTYHLALKQPPLIKIVKNLKENENLKFNQFIDLTAVDYPNKKNSYQIKPNIKFNSSIFKGFKATFIG